jgi:uridylate kinase
MGLAMEHAMPIIVFDTMQAGNILKAAEGNSVGTIIS